MRKIELSPGPGRPSEHVEMYATPRLSSGVMLLMPWCFTGMSYAFVSPVFGSYTIGYPPG